MLPEEAETSGDVIPLADAKRAREAAGPARSRRTGRSTEGAGDAHRPPLERLPPDVRPLAEHLAGTALGEEPAEPPGFDRWAARIDVEMLQLAVEAVREEIERSRRGATTSVRAAGIAHQRLDAAAFDLARKILGMRERSQRRLIEEVSHDLRSPLNSVLFLADALANDHGGELNPVQRRQVGVLYTAAVTLVKLVNDLIDYARLGDDDIRVASVSFSVESVLGDVRRLVGPLVHHRRVEFVQGIQAEGLRTGDPQLLSRVLLNLVSNAIQVVSEGGKVSVRVTETEEGHLRAEVLDDGLGTDVDRLRRLIEPPARGDRVGETRGWTRGLGLAISSRLVQAAGGRMSVESLAGEGTCFAVELPFPRL